MPPAGAAGRQLNGDSGGAFTFTGTQTATTGSGKGGGRGVVRHAMPMGSTGSSFTKGAPATGMLASITALANPHALNHSLLQFVVCS